MASINPRAEQIKQLVNTVPAGKPVEMLNLLRFKEFANYEGENVDLTGREAYKIYAEAAFTFIQALGGELVWKGSVAAGVICPADESWDEAFLVRYPSIEDFLSMIQNPDYQAITNHRTAALDDSRLICTLAG